MKQSIVNALRRRVPRPLWVGLRKAYRLSTGRARIVELAGKSLSPSRLEELESNPDYGEVFEDLLAYTGFTRDILIPYLLRNPERHFLSEFNWYGPRTRTELTWFYRCSMSYLFTNAVHPYDRRLDAIRSGHVLDYGAGAGCNTIGLATRGIAVDFLEVSRIQADFISFRARRHGLEKVSEVLPEFQGAFDTVQCIEQEYDAVVAMDVLEHIPDYHLVVERFIEHLRPGGLIVENSPFDPAAPEIAIHVRPSVPMEEAMVGMSRVSKGVWRKAGRC